MWSAVGGDSTIHADYDLPASIILFWIHSIITLKLATLTATNVMLYEVNTSTVASMLEGSLLLQGVETLCSVLAITLIGTHKLPNDWLSWTFRVRRQAVHEALQWLHEHNLLYQDIKISHEHLAVLPEDRIPEEIEAVIWYEEDETVAVKEREGYVMEDLPNANSEPPN